MDISGWQDFKSGAPTAAFFAGARLDGRMFCFIKASETETTAAGKRYDSRSTTYAERYHAASLAGLHAGAYHFAAPTADPEEARRQARLMFAVCGPCLPGDLPPGLDCEVAPTGLSCAQLTAWIIAFLREIAQLTGRKPLLYSYLDFIHERLGGPEAAELAAWDLWLACYSGNQVPKAPAPWKRWTVWQRTGTGRRPFWPGDLDLDVFAGTPAELAAYCGSTSAGTEDRAAPAATPQ